MSESIPKSRPSSGQVTPQIIIHGGAGAISRSWLPPELYESYRKSLLAYLTETAELLRDANSPATALDAACHAVSLMEDDPLFNCGRGSVFTRDGHVEMEASIAVTSIAHSDIPDSIKDYIEWPGSKRSSSRMNSYPGHVKRSAAVSQLRNTRHPIHLAREVLLTGDEDEGLGGVSSMHGHLSGRNVEEWGWKERGLERKPDDWFWTKRRWDEHRRGLHKGKNSKFSDFNSLKDFEIPLPSQGTVGCVALDIWGNLAVATSTGGLTNKLPGRVGDTPTVGAGFWAESWNKSNSEQSTEVSSPIHPHQQREHRLFVTPNILEQHVPGPFERFGKLVDTHLSTISCRSFFSRLSLPSKPSCETENSLLCSTFEAEKSRYHRIDLEKGYIVDFDSRKFLPVASKSYNTVRSSIFVSPPGAGIAGKRRRAIAISGTGNGDSFLRTVACRTVGSLCQSNSVAGQTSLANAISQVAGKDGILQRSACDRWGVTGEGQGGIIGIEMIYEEDADLAYGKDKVSLQDLNTELKNKNAVLKTNVVFDFNCGGMWRAYFDEHGNATVMVFREKY